MKNGERGSGMQAFPQVRENGAGKQLHKQEAQAAVRVWDKCGDENGEWRRKWPVRVAAPLGSLWRAQRNFE